MSDPWAERLSECLDGELPPEEAAHLEQHLRECASCRQVLAELRMVVARLAGDPLRVEDQPTLHRWNAIRRKIGTGAARRRWIWRAAIAASLAGVALATQWWPQRDGTVADSLAPGGYAADYRQATADLEAILREQRSTLRPETIRALESSLAAIDSAVAQASAALAADPGNEYITRHLARLRDTRLAALRSAVLLVLQRG